MRLLILASTILLLAGCSQPSTTTAPGPHAVILLRDGSQYAGNVMRSSPTEIAIAGDDKNEHTFAMSNVKTVDYGESAVAPAPPLPQATQAPAPIASAPQRPLVAPTQQELAHEQEHYHPADAVVRSTTYNLPVGTQLVVRTEETIDARSAEEGQIYAAEVSRDVRDAAGIVVIPRGSNAQIIIRSASAGGRIRGTSDLILDLASVSINGRRYHVSTLDLREKGKAGIGENKRTAKYVGGGALFGTIVGAIAGHGKGAAIGALSGAAAGGTAQVITKGRAIHIPVETLLTFQLDLPLHVSTTR